MEIIMAVKIAYNNMPSLVLLCQNRVTLEPAGMKKDHAELTAEQQVDDAVVSWAAQGKISLLSIDEAAKKEGRRVKTTAAPSVLPKVAVTNPEYPPVPEKPVEKVEEKPVEKPVEKIEVPEEKLVEKVEEEKPEPKEEEDKGKSRKSKKTRRK